MTMTEPEKILIVEDDVSFCALLVDEVEDAGYRVRSAHTVEEAHATLAEWSPDLVLCDLRLPGADGLTFLHLTRERALPPAFILITAFGTVPQAVEALKAGADDFLTKPLDLDHLRLRLARTLENRRLRQEIGRFHEQFGRADFRGMVGRSDVMRVLFEQIQRVAQAAGPVLITGESGTGKELVARAIHEESTRARKAFIAVNCAGVPGGSAGKRILRPPGGGIHRRRPRPQGFIRRSRRRYAVSGRDRGDAGQSAGQVAAGAAGRQDAPGRQRQRAACGSTRRSRN